MPYGWDIRNRLFAAAMQGLDGMGYQEVHLPNLVSSQSLTLLDEIYPLSRKYYHVSDNVFLAASHEAVIFSFLDRFLRNRPECKELRYYHLGPVFRQPNRSSAGPLALGERSSFLEAYSIFRSLQSLRIEFRRSVEWAGELVRQLALPSLHVRRPKIGNHPLSEVAVSFETILPHGRTFASAMIYLQGTIFTDRFFSEERAAANYRSLHFGISDNIVMNYLASLSDDRGLCLQSTISPHQVAILHTSSTDELYLSCRQVLESLRRMGMRVVVEREPRQKIFRRVKHFHRRGVPIVIVLIEEDTWRGDFIVFPRLLPSKLVRFECVQDVLDLVSANDEAIRDVSSAIHRTAVVQASSPDEVASVVADGRVASFYLREDEKQVEKLMARLPVGEVLGFDQSRREDLVGVDIFDDRTEGRLCYASRRV